jgi:hypothetical protein
MLHIFSINWVKCVVHMSTATDIKGRRKYFRVSKSRWRTQYRSILEEESWILKILRKMWPVTSLEIFCAKSLVDLVLGAEIATVTCFVVEMSGCTSWTAGLGAVLIASWWESVLPRHHKPSILLYMWAGLCRGEARPPCTLVHHFNTSFLM